MSFGSETARTRTSSKGFSSSRQKKAKRKKQEYHSHKKLHLQDESEADMEEVRARTVLALDRLGHQVLSSEPGGYDLHDWRRNFDALLDDFQERVGEGRMTEELLSRRREAEALLAPPASTAEVDSEIERLREEEGSARATVEDAQTRAANRLSSLRAERDKCIKELAEKREALQEVRRASQSRSFFSRVFGTGPSTAKAEAEVTERESRLGRLESEIEHGRKGRGLESDVDEAKLAETDSRLENLRARLLELGQARQERAQLTREREVAAKMVSDAISSMKLGPPVRAEGASQSP